MTLDELIQALTEIRRENPNSGTMSVSADTRYTSTTILRVEAAPDGVALWDEADPA